MTSRYGVRMGIQPPHRPTFHAGIDLGISGARVGTVPIYCVAAGVIEAVGQDDQRAGAFNGYGNCVAVRHDLPGEAPVWTLYAHQHHFAQTWAAGTPLAVGTLIGFVGATNNGKFPNMGPHLHFETRHAAAGGGSPFPGPYPRLTTSGTLNNPLNIDPQEWLAAHGIRFGPRGVIVPEPPNACDPATMVRS